MRIVNIILTSQNGGAEQVFIDYLCILKFKLGHEVMAIIKHDAPYAAKLEELGISYKKINNNFGFHDFFAASSIKKILQEFNSDAVVAHAGRSISLVRKAVKKIHNKKILQVAINHSMNIKRSIGADVIISINKSMFYKTIDFGQDQQKSFIIHNAIDLSDAEFTKPQIDWSKKDVITIGCIGRLDDRAKGFDFAIKTIKLLENYPNKKFKLRIAGKGCYEVVLRNLAKEMKVEDKIEFVGWISDKKSFFDSCDIFLLTSLKETFGLVVLEAMKFGKSIIVSNSDGPKEIIRNEVEGILVNLEPIENAEIRFAEAVKKIINDSNMTNKMIENSFVTVKEKFSFDVLEKKLKDIFGTGVLNSK